MMEDNKIVLMAIDIGGASENGITIMNEREQILHYESVKFNKSLGKGHHRREISKHISFLVDTYNVQRILVERVNLFRGDSVSKLANIESLSRLVAGITDATYDRCQIYDVAVKSWKAQVLGNTSKDKQFAINYVKLLYKLDVSEHVADSICIAVFGIRNWIRFEDELKNITAN